MKFKFWLLLVISVFFPLLVVGAWGRYYIQSFENQAEERIVTEVFKQEQFFYLKSLDTKLFSLEKKVEKVLEEKLIDDESPLAALMVIDVSQKKIIQEYFSDNKDFYFNKESVLNRTKIKSFVKGFKKDPKDSVQFDIFSLNKTNKMNVVALDVNRFSALKNKKYLVVGVLKDNSFFQNTQALIEEDLKTKKFFLLNSQGRILFHNDSQHLFKKLLKTSVVRESIEDSYYSQNKPQWVLKTSKSKSKKGITYIQKWEGKGAFLVTKKSFSSSSLLFNSWTLKWSLFCLGIFFLICVGLIFIISPLFSAYNYLKYFFIYFSKTGEAPSWVRSIKNPYLYFYNNRSEYIHSFKKDLEAPRASSRTQTFQSLLQEEVKKLQFKYSGLKVIEKIDSNMKLFGFENFMRTILHELLLNAVESMGAYETQDIAISSKEENEQFMFSIKDLGSGLLEEDRKKVFQLYYSTKSQLGVGLNLVQSLVISNNGTIDFLSSPEQKGLEVVITLPLNCFFQVATNNKRGDFHFLKKDVKTKKSSKVLV